MTKSLDDCADCEGMVAQEYLHRSRLGLGLGLGLGLALGLALGLGLGLGFEAEGGLLGGNGDHIGLDG